MEEAFRDTRYIHRVCSRVPSARASDVRGGGLARGRHDTGGWATLARALAPPAVMFSTRVASLGVLAAAALLASAASPAGGAPFCTRPRGSARQPRALRNVRRGGLRLRRGARVVRRRRRRMLRQMVPLGALQRAPRRTALLRCQDESVRRAWAAPRGATTFPRTCTPSSRRAADALERAKVQPTRERQSGLRAPGARAQPTEDRQSRRLRRGTGRRRRRPTRMPPRRSYAGDENASEVRRRIAKVGPLRRRERRMVRAPAPGARVRRKDSDFSTKKTLDSRLRVRAFEASPQDSFPGASRVSFPSRVSGSTYLSNPPTLAPLARLLALAPLYTNSRSFPHPTLEGGAEPAARRFGSQPIRGFLTERRRPGSRTGSRRLVRRQHLREPLRAHHLLVHFPTLVRLPAVPVLEPRLRGNFWRAPRRPAAEYDPRLAPITAAEPCATIHGCDSICDAPSRRLGSFSRHRRMKSRASGHPLRAFGDVRLLRQDASIRLFRRVGLERRAPGETLERQDADRPAVNLRSVPAPIHRAECVAPRLVAPDNLRRHVVDGAEAG